jgi:MFS family permease
VPGIVEAGCVDHLGTDLGANSLGLVTVLMGVGQVIGPYLAGLMADTYGTLEYSYVLAAGVFLLASALGVSLRLTVDSETGCVAPDEVS